MNQNIPFNSGAIRASDCISDAWELIKDQYWMFFGMTFLGIVLLGCIPCLNIFLVGPFLVGIYIAFMTKMRGEAIKFELLFKGFEKFVPAMVIGLIVNIPGIIAQILQFSLNITGNVLGTILKNKGRDYDFFAPSDMAPAIAGGVILIFLIIFAVFILFSLAWHITFMFALPLVAEHDLSIGEALSLSARAGWSNVGGIFVLVILQILVGFLGFLAICIGVYFVLPIIYGANFLAYRMVFPAVAPKTTYNEPPRPDFYGSSFGNS